MVWEGGEGRRGDARGGRRPPDGPRVGASGCQIAGAGRRGCVAPPPAVRPATAYVTCAVGALFAGDAAGSVGSPRGVGRGAVGDLQAPFFVPPRGAWPGRVAYRFSVVAHTRRRERAVCFPTLFRSVSITVRGDWRIWGARRARARRLGEFNGP